MDKIVIVNTEKRGIQLPEASSELSEERQGLLLLPGENSVSAGYWANVQDNPAVKIWLRVGYLKNKGAGEAVPLATDWNALSLDKARSLVAKIDDVMSLNKIKKSAKKKNLRSIVDERIKELLDEGEAENK